MSYKLPDQPADTPRVNEWEFASDGDQYGQICGLMRSKHGRTLERENTKLRELAKRLLKHLKHFDCDDEGQELKDEAESELN